VKSNTHRRRNAATKAIVVFLLLVSPRVTTGADYIDSGTIIVIAQTKERIIIAADSRSGETTDGVTVKSVDDSACKIAAFRRDSVFSAAGILRDRENKWTSMSEALDVLRTAAPGPIGSRQGEAILDRWADAMAQRVRVFSSDQLLAYSSNNAGHILTGVLAGIEDDKQPWLRAVMVNFSSAAGFSHQSYTLISNDPPTAYYFLGKPAIGLEFERDKSSSRAVKERASWNRENLTGPSLDRFKARRLVELTIMYHSPKTEVGGAVDEVELDASGVRWLHVKPNCTQMYR
jgi:hypothetical protein